MATWRLYQRSTECAGVKAVKTRTFGTVRRCVFARLAGNGKSSAITRPCPSTWMGAIALRWIFNRRGVAPDRGSSAVTRRWAELKETPMPDSLHVAVVRRLYEARGNPDVIQQVLAPDIRWEVVEGFPYGGVYVGLD